MQESLSVATKTKAIKPSELSRVIVDTTGAAQERDVPHRREASEPGRREKLVRLAQRHGVALRQSYTRVVQVSLWSSTSVLPTPSSSSAPTGCSRSCAPYSAVSSATSIARSRAGQRARRDVRTLLLLARRGARAEATSARPEGSIPCMRRKSECIGKGKAHRPYEFGVKVSVATTISHAKGRPVRHPCEGACPATRMTVIRWQP